MVGSKARGKDNKQHHCHQWGCRCFYRCQHITISSSSSNSKSSIFLFLEICFSLVLLFECLRGNREERILAWSIEERNLRSSIVQFRRGCRCCFDIYCQCECHTASEQGRNASLFVLFNALEIQICKPTIAKIMMTPITTTTTSTTPTMMTCDGNRYK